MSANEIAMVFLVVLVMGIPGSYLGGYLTVRFKSPILAAIVCEVGFIVVTTVASFVLTGPGAKHMALPFSFLWGIGLGWLTPVDVTIFMNLMPNDSQTEFMGIMTLATDVLSFLPALTFSVLNEAGFKMSWGLISLSSFFGLAILCLAQIGDYKRARTEATRSSSLLSSSSTPPSLLSSSSAPPSLLSSSSASTAMGRSYTEDPTDRSGIKNARYAAVPHADETEVV